MSVARWLGLLAGTLACGGDADGPGRSNSAVQIQDGASPRRSVPSVASNTNRTRVITAPSPGAAATTPEVEEDASDVGDRGLVVTEPGDGRSVVVDAGIDALPSQPGMVGTVAIAADTGPPVEVLDAGRIDGPGAIVDAGDGGDGALEVGDASEAGLEPQSYHERIRARLESCGALGAGEFVPPRVDDARAECIANCMLAVPCTDLQHYLCQQSAPLMYNCQNECEKLVNETPFACGDGQLIWPALRCDGLYDCANYADEDACGEHQCADGTSVPAPARCDLWPSCADQSDEASCALLCPP
jgi:hypothetical protein